MKDKGNVSVTTVTLDQEKLTAAKNKMRVSSASEVLRRLVDVYLGWEVEENDELKELMDKKKEAEERVLEAEAEVAKLQREVFEKMPKNTEVKEDVKEYEKEEVREGYVEKVNEFLKTDPEYRGVWEFQCFVPKDVMQKYVGSHKKEMEELGFKNEAAMQRWLLEVTEGRLCVKTK